MPNPRQQTATVMTIPPDIRLHEPGEYPLQRVGDIVYLVGENRCGREVLSERLAASGFQVITFRSGAEYLIHAGTDEASCVILDLQLPDMSGLDLQSELAEKMNPPVIFISDRCDVPSIVRAMKAGAFEFYTVPLDLPALFDAIRAALEQDRRSRQKKAELEMLKQRYSLLTPREREVLPLVAGGLLNKQAAVLLGVSEVTLQVHRGQVMRKMQAESFAELVRMAVTLGIPHYCGT